jgi:hypothetical protein
MAMKKKKVKPSAKGPAKTSGKKPDPGASPAATTDSPLKKAPGKTDDNNERVDEIPGATSVTAITNQDAQDTITNQSSGQAATPDNKSEREEHQGERMGPAYLDDDSEVLSDESEQITPER